MNELQKFLYTDKEIRVVTKEGEPWFVAADVCRVLEIDNATKALVRLDDDEKALISIQGISRGNDNTNIVNEPGLYTLVLGSRKPEAKAFKRWVTHEVIPSIRKHGSYLTPEATEKALHDPDSIRGAQAELSDLWLRMKVEAMKPPRSQRESTIRALREDMSRIQEDIHELESSRV